MGRQNPAGTGRVRVRALRTAYRFAWAARAGLRLLPFPPLDGAMAAVWCEGHILLVRNSYNRYHTLPGGRRQAGESYVRAAARELAEETGVAVDEAHLRPAGREVLRYGLRRDVVEVHEIELDARPALVIDPVEIAEALWATPEEAARMALFGPARRYLESRR
jgi:ADP-ribose pyrophosphatase YjhB (NUDIX family)